MSNKLHGYQKHKVEGHQAIAHFSRNGLTICALEDIVGKQFDITIIGTTFIEPNKRSAIFESGVQTGSQEAYTAYFKVSSVQKWEKTEQSFAYNLFSIGEPQLSNQEVAPKIQVSIKNTSYQSYTDVPVIAVVYNQEDNAIAASQTYIDQTGQDQESTAYFSWPQPFGEAVSRIEIIPRVDPFKKRLE